MIFKSSVVQEMRRGAGAQVSSQRVTNRDQYVLTGQGTSEFDEEEAD